MHVYLPWCASVLLLAASQTIATPVGLTVDFDNTDFGAALCYNDLDCPTAESAGPESLDFPNASINSNTISENGAGIAQLWAVFASQVLDIGDTTKATLDFSFIRLSAQAIEADKQLIVSLFNLNSQPNATAPELVLTGPVTGEFLVNGTTSIAWEFPDPVSLTTASPGQFDLELDFGINGLAEMFEAIQPDDVIDIVGLTLPIMVTPEPNTLLYLAVLASCQWRRRGLARKGSPCHRRSRYHRRK